MLENSACVQVNWERPLSQKTWGGGGQGVGDQIIPTSCVGMTSCCWSAFWNMIAPKVGVHIWASVADQQEIQNLKLLCAIRASIKLWRCPLGANKQSPPPLGVRKWLAAARLFFCALIYSTVHNKQTFDGYHRCHEYTLSSCVFEFHLKLWGGRMFWNTVFNSILLLWFKTNFYCPDFKNGKTLLLVLGVWSEQGLILDLGKMVSLTLQQSETNWLWNYAMEMPSGGWSERPRNAILEFESHVRSHWLLQKMCMIWDELKIQQNTCLVGCCGP